MEYETKLEELRRLRRDALGISTKQTLADHALIRRVHFIYQRATRKFRGDLALWSAWLACCKATKSTRKFSQVHMSPCPLPVSRVPSSHAFNAPPPAYLHTVSTCKHRKLPVDGWVTSSCGSS